MNSQNKLTVVLVLVVVVVVVAVVAVAVVAVAVVVVSQGSLKICLKILAVSGIDIH